MRGEGSVDDPAGRGDPLYAALITYKRLLSEGVVHSLALRSGGRDHNAWTVEWTACTTFHRGEREDEWVRVKIVQNDLYVLGQFALRTLMDHDAAAARAAVAEH